MSTKYTNSNLFELLQVDSDLPDQKRTKTQAKKPAETGPNVETPAEKAQRRKAAEAQKAAAAAAEKQKRETEQAMAAAFPQEGWEVQKGSQAKKQTEKGKVLNREQFNEKSPETERKSFVKGPITGRKFDERKPGEKQHPRGDHQLKQNVTRPNRHEGYDKHSGGKTTNKPPAKKGGAGVGNWGGEVDSTTVAAEWDTAVATPVTSTTPGWGDEGETKVAPVASEPGWGDDKDQKSDKSDKKDEGEREDKPKKASEPAWDDEGFGKMTVEEFQKTVAAKRAEDLAALTGAKTVGRQIENTVDLSKCSYRDTSDEKEKKLAEERRKEKAEEAKRRGQQRAGTQNVDLSQYIDVRTRGGGRGGRGGGRGGDRGDRPPRSEGEQQSSPDPNRAARGGRGGGRGGDRSERGGKLKPSAFPALEKPVAQATPAPKSTK